MARQRASRHEVACSPVSIGRAETRETVALPSCPSGQYAGDDGRVVQPAAEDCLDQIVQGRPHGIHVSLFALPGETVWMINIGQVAGEIDAQ